MESTAGPVGQPPNSCRMMSRCPQHSDIDDRLQAVLLVAEPAKPSSYIQ